MVSRDILLLIAAFALLALAPLVAGGYALHVIIVTLLAVGLGVSYRPLVMAGEASLCHGTFYGLGAYTSALLTVKLGWSFWASLPVAAAIPGVAAMVLGLPALRTRGPYFFLMTFGFLVVVNSVLANWKSLTNGHRGITGIPAPEGIAGINGHYALVLGLVAAGMVLFRVLDRSRWALDLRALGMSEAVAESTGINRFATMLSALVLGAAYSGLLGAAFASYSTYISPMSFGFWLSTFIFTYVVIGGSKYFYGAVAGAIYISLMPVVFAWSEKYVALFVAASIVAAITFLPRGIVTALYERAGRDRPATPARLASAAPVLARTDGGRTNGDRSGGDRRVMLETRQIDKHFGGLHAIDSVSLSVRSGEIFGLIGPNGAGKTTLFNLLTGVLRPDKGAVWLDGQDVTALPQHAIARKGLVRTFQQSAVYDDLTLLDSVRAGISTPISAARRLFWPLDFDREQTGRAIEMLDFCGLADLAGTRAGDLPYGTKKIAGIAVAAVSRPKVLCLDEPATGMTGEELDHLVAIIRRLNRELGITIIVVEHRVPLIMQLCDRIAVLNFGSLVETGSPAEIRESSVAKQVYFA